MTGNDLNLQGGKGMFILILFIISLVVATILVNTAQRLYMKLMGAEMMFFSGKKKLIAIVVVGLLILGTVAQLFGLA